MGNSKNPAAQSRSARRTKTALKNSLLNLMKTRPLLRISVKEICAGADVGRSTFYAHYDNQYDLLKELEEETLAVFEDALGMKEPLRRQTNREIAQKIEKTLQCAADNRGSIQIQLSENGGAGFRQKFMRHFTQYLADTQKQYTDNPADEITNECYTVFFVHGLTALARHWLENPARIAAADLANMIVLLTSELRR